MKTFFVLLALFELVASLTIRLQQISTPFTRPVGIDYHEFTNTLLLTAHYPDGNPYNFERIEFDGSHVQFSPIRGLTEECKLAVARSGNIGGFQAGEFFTGNGIPGQIVRITPSGTLENPWVTLPGEGGLMRGSLYVDPWGVWGGNLIVATTAGNVWRITSAKVATKIASVGVHLEGVLTVPNDPGRYGFLSGKILAGDEQNARLWAFDITGTVSQWTVPIAIEDIDYIYDRENFYGVNYGEGRLLGATADQFDLHEGEILCTTEGVSPSSSGLYLLTWNSVTSRPEFEQVLLSSAGINNFAGPRITQWEHVTFAPAGILEIPPAIPVCYKLRNKNQVDLDLVPYPIPSGLSVVGWYSYNVPIAGQSNFIGGLPSAGLAGTLTMFFARDAKNILSLVIHVDANSASGGTVEIDMGTVNLDIVRGGRIQVQDDPASAQGDNYIWNNGQGVFRFTWTAGTSDGMVISPIPIAGNVKATCFRPQILSHTGLTKWQIITWNTANAQFTNRDLAWDDTPSICAFECSKTCFLHSDCVSCAVDPACTWCDSTKQCLQTVGDPDLASCNATYATECPCSITASTCDSCVSNPKGCGWCCSAQGGNCLEGDNGGPIAPQTCPNWRFGTCPSEDCNPPCVRGTCTCGQCVCPRTYGGPTCNLTEGCDGVIGSGKIVDVCGECGGNGLSCLGCDGIPFGKKYDICGVCGGNGTTCWTRCPYDECKKCNDAENCQWCGNADSGTVVCAEMTADEQCPNGLTKVDDCSTFKLGTGEIVGLSVGIIILIVGLIVVCLVLAGVGSKLGYDYMMKHRKGMAAPQTNPLYTAKGMEGNNPMYEH